MRVVLADHFRDRLAQEARARGVNHQITPLSVLHEHGIGRPFGDGPQEIMTLLKGLFRPRARWCARPGP